MPVVYRAKRDVFTDPIQRDLDTAAFGWFAADRGDSDPSFEVPPLNLNENVLSPWPADIRRPSEPTLGYPAQAAVPLNAPDFPHFGWSPQPNWEGGRMFGPQADSTSRWNAGGNFGPCGPATESFGPPTAGIDSSESQPTRPMPVMDDFDAHMYRFKLDAPPTGRSPTGNSKHFAACPTCYRPAEKCGQTRRGTASGLMVCNRCGQYERRTGRPRPFGLEHRSGGPKFPASFGGVPRPTETMLAGVVGPLGCGYEQQY